MLLLHSVVALDVLQQPQQVQEEVHNVLQQQSPPPSNKTRDTPGQLLHRAPSLLDKSHHLRKIPPPNAKLIQAPALRNFEQITSAFQLVCYSGPCYAVLCASAHSPGRLRWLQTHTRPARCCRCRLPSSAVQGPSETGGRRHSRCVSNQHMRHTEAFDRLVCPAPLKATTKTNPPAPAPFPESQCMTSHVSSRHPHP